MKFITIVFFTLFTLQCFSQNDEYKIYKDAINIVRETPEFSNYVRNNNVNKFIKLPQVDAERLIPICPYNDWLDNIDCDLDGLLKDMTRKHDIDLSKFSMFSDEGDNNALLCFSVSENLYFVAELTSKKKKTKNVLYLFKIENENIILKQIAFRDGKMKAW